MELGVSAVTLADAFRGEHVVGFLEHVEWPQKDRRKEVSKGRAASLKSLHITYRGTEENSGGKEEGQIRASLIDMS